MTHRLFYVCIRGRAEPIRYVLEETKTSYINDYNCDEIKKRLIFRQVPALVTPQGQTVVQSNAILRHLGRTKNLYGKNETEMTNVDVMLDGIEDWRGAYYGLVLRDKLQTDAFKAYERAVHELEAKGMGYFPKFEKWLETQNQGKGFLVGNGLTIADFSLFELVDSHVRILPKCLDSYPLFKSWFSKIANRPNIASYIASNPPHRAQLNANGLG